MKKALTLNFVILILSLSLVFPVSAAEYMGSQPATDFAKIITDYDIISTDPRDIFSALFGLQKSDVKYCKVDATAENVMTASWMTRNTDYPTAAESAEHLKWLEIYYYDFDGNNEDPYNADVRLFVHWQQYEDDKGQFYDAYMTLFVDSAHFDKLESTMKNYLSTINTPQDIFNLAGKTPSTEYFSRDSYQSGQYQYKVNGFMYDESEPESGILKTWFYNKLFGDGIIVSLADSPANDCTFFVAPDRVKIARGFNKQFSLYGTDPTYNYKIDSNSESWDLTVNYSAPDGVNEEDYLLYTIDSIELTLIIDLLPITAPQTGVDTFAYAAVAIVALASVAVVVKKRKA